MSSKKIKLSKTDKVINVNKARQVFCHSVLESVVFDALTLKDTHTHAL